MFLKFLSFFYIDAPLIKLLLNTVRVCYRQKRPVLRSRENVWSAQGINVSGVAEPINFMVGSGGIKVSGVEESINFMVGYGRFSACGVEPLFGRLRV